MAWDIYGNHLRPGHCEAHPNVHEEYPCSLCFYETSVDLAFKQQEQEYEKIEREYYEAMEKDHFEFDVYQHSKKYRLLVALCKFFSNIVMRLEVCKVRVIESYTYDESGKLKRLHVN